MTARFETPDTVLVTPQGTWQVLQEDRRYPTESDPGDPEVDRDIWIFRSGSDDGSDLDYRKVAHDATPADIEAAPVQFFPGALQSLIHGLTSGVPIVSPSLKQAVQTTDGRVWFTWSIDNADGTTGFVSAIWDGVSWLVSELGSTATGQDVLSGSVDRLDNGSLILAYAVRADGGGFTGGEVYYKVLVQSDVATTAPGPPAVPFTRLDDGTGFVLSSPGHTDAAADLRFGGLLIGQKPGPEWYLSWGVQGLESTVWYVSEAGDLVALTGADVFTAASLPEVADITQSGVTHLQGFDHVWQGHRNDGTSFVVSSTLGIKNWCTTFELGKGTGPHVALVSRDVPGAVGVLSLLSFDSCLNGSLGYFSGTTAVFSNTPEYACDPCADGDTDMISIYRKDLTAFHDGLVPSKANTKRRC